MNKTTMDRQKKFNALKKSCLKRNIPIVTDSTKNFLKDLIQKHKPKNCIEIWTAVGYSSLYIHNLIQKRNGNLKTFEISFPSYQEALENFQKFQAYNIQSYNYNFNKIPIKRLINHKIDFVFIDARKSDYLRYLRKLYPYLSSNGHIIFDDVIKFRHKMEWLYRFIEKNQLEYQIHQIDKDDGILYLPINPNKETLNAI